VKSPPPAGAWQVEQEFLAGAKIADEVIAA